DAWPQFGGALPGDDRVVGRPAMGAEEPAEARDGVVVAGGLVQRYLRLGEQRAANVGVDRLRLPAGASSAFFDQRAGYLDGLPEPPGEDHTVGDLPGEAGHIGTERTDERACRKLGADPLDGAAHRVERAGGPAAPADAHQKAVLRNDECPGVLDELVDRATVERQHAGADREARHLG